MVKPVPGKLYRVQKIIETNTTAITLYKMEFDAFGYGDGLPIGRLNYDEPFMLVEIGKAPANDKIYKIIVRDRIGWISMRRAGQSEEMVEVKS